MLQQCPASYSSTSNDEGGDAYTDELERRTPLSGSAGDTALALPHHPTGIFPGDVALARRAGATGRSASDRSPRHLAALGHAGNRGDHAVRRAAGVPAGKGGLSCTRSADATRLLTPSVPTRRQWYPAAAALWPLWSHRHSVCQCGTGTRLLLHRYRPGADFCCLAICCHCGAFRL